MAVDKIALFEATKALWPLTVRVAESPEATNQIYRANEEAVSQADEWLQLALWAFHQALADHEKRALAKGFPLHPHEVTFSEFDTWMRVNLNGDDCWLGERAEYENG